MAIKKTKFMGRDQAFEDFIKNVYPKITAEEKKKVKDLVSRFNKKKNYSQDKIQEVLEKYGYFIDKPEVWVKEK